MMAMDRDNPEIHCCPMGCAMAREHHLGTRMPSAGYWLANDPAGCKGSEARRGGMQWTHANDTATPCKTASQQAMRAGLACPRLAYQGQCSSRDEHGWPRLWSCNAVQCIAVRELNDTVHAHSQATPCPV
jgi:hypothetical protein